MSKHDKTITPRNKRDATPHSTAILAPFHTSLMCGLYTIACSLGVLILLVLLVYLKILTCKLEVPGS